MIFFASVERVSDHRGAEPPNSVECRSDTVNIVMLASDLKLLKTPLKSWPAVSANTYKTFGQNEVDFNFYPTWAGNDRFIVLDMNDQTKFGINCSEFVS